MASEPPHHGTYAHNSDPDPDPNQRWTGRARVGPPPAPPPPPPQYVRPAPPRQGPPTRGIRPRWGRIALVSFALLALLAGSGILVGYLWFRGVDSGIKREDPFAQLEGRPPKVVDGSLNILLLGSDSRDPSRASEGVTGERTDTIVIMHIPASHDRAYLVSIPRDTWVHIPKSAGCQNCDTMDKINAAYNGDKYATGGMRLMVQTVEEFTGVRMDHVAVIDFGGFVKVTDAVGGVDMTVDQAIDSIHPPYRHFNAGPQHFNGEEALDYVRQRYQFADGDFTRIKHQQMFLKALMDKAVSVGTVTNIGSLKDFVSAVADTMTVDQDFSLFDLAWQFHSLRSEDMTFLVSPNSGTGTIDGQSVVVSDKRSALSFYNAMANDTLGDWVVQHGSGNGSGAYAGG
jgi:LCP family protein required for cell wall assembly